MLGSWMLSGFFPTAEWIANVTTGKFKMEKKKFLVHKLVLKMNKSMVGVYLAEIII